MIRWIAAASTVVVLIQPSHRRLVREDIPRRSVQCSASDLEEIVGYTALVSSNVTADFEGADFAKLVELDNGMIFRFREYKYTYSYRPDVIVFTRISTYQGRSITVYKLLIDDELYEVVRVR